MKFLGIHLLGTDANPLEAQLLGGAIVYADGFVEDASTLRDRPPLSSETEKAIGADLDTLDLVSDSSTQLVESYRYLIDEAMGDGDTVLCVWNAPAHLTLLAEGGWTPKGPIVDLKVLDRAYNPDRRGRRNLESTAEWYGVPISRSTTGPESKAMLAARVGRVVYDAVAHLYPDLNGYQQRAHRFQTQELRDWLTKQHRPSAHLDNGWPVREGVRAVDDWSLVDAWLDGDGDVKEARAALLRLRNNR